MRLHKGSRPTGKPAGRWRGGKQDDTDKREPFNAGDFSSRKLMELVSGERDGDRLMLDRRRSTQWSPSWQADATIFASSAIAATRPAHPRALHSKDLDRPRSGDVAAFLRQTRAIQAVTQRQARLILPWTPPQAASQPGLRREHCMANCLALQQRPLRWRCSSATTAAWPDSLKSVAHRSGALLDQMSGVGCEAGITQIGGVLRHARMRALHRSPFVRSSSSVMPAKGTRTAVVTCRSVRHQKTAAVSVSGRQRRHHPRRLRADGQVSGGATMPFDASSADRLRQLLGAVAQFARGGLKALRDSGAAGDRLLLDQLEKGP